MLEPDELRAAVEAGVLDAQQADRLAAFLASRGGAAESPDPDDERFKLIGGYNDIFVTLGIVLVFAPLAVLMWHSYALPYVCAVTAWALAEIFTRRRRMALPSIALSIGFSLACAGAAGFALNDISAASALTPASYSILLVGAAVAAGAFAHHLRFRVPIDIALIFLGVLSMAVSALLLWSPDWLAAHAAAYALCVGLVAFAFAMWFDLSDPARITHRSDTAFWLHLVAAPLIVHGILAGVIGASRFSGEHAGSVLLVTLVFTLVALAVDRRALIVAALTYAGGAIAYILKGLNGGGRDSDSLTFTLLLLGAAILLLSVGWRWLRALIVPRLPLGALVARLPPIHAA